MKIKLTKYIKKNNDNFHWKCIEAGNNMQQYNQDNKSRPDVRIKNNRLYLFQFPFYFNFIFTIFYARRFRVWV